MKKKLCALILAMACVCSLGTTGASAAGMDEQEGYSTTVISGEDAIQAYLEEVGEPYDPNLVEVIRVEYERNIENKRPWYEIPEETDEPEEHKEENIMLLPHFRANFKTGYWEAVFSHTRPLGVVPWDMRG